jgi:transformation/transcription domain-associated protein
MKMMVTVVREDNEENAVMAIKVIIDLHRHLKTELEGEVAPFLQLVGDLYKNFKKSVAIAFDNDASTKAEGGSTVNKSSDNLLEAPSPATDPQSTSLTGSEVGISLGNAAQPKTLSKSFSSFKVLTECPIATVFILQTYKSNVPQAISLFLPLTIEECLMQQAPPQKEAHEAAKARGETFVGVAPGIKNRALFTEMVVAQVKTMSFLAYVIKGSTVHMRPYAHVVPGIAVRLLQDCPPEASTTRKELLVAIRHIFTTDLRGNFIDQIDILLNPRVFLGTGITTRETLRPLAISMLADLVHHIRNELTYDQVVLTTHRHCQMLHDPTLAPSILTMCTKLLTNLVETIATRHADGAQVLLRAIFDSLVEKLAGLPRLREDFEKMREHKKEPEKAQMDAVTIERGKTVQVNVMIPDFGPESFKGEITGPSLWH